MDYISDKVIEKLEKKGNSNSNSSLKEAFYIELIKFGFASVLAIGSFYVIKRLLSANVVISKDKKERLANKLKRPDVAKMDFSSHEARFFTDIISADEIDVTFEGESFIAILLIAYTITCVLLTLPSSLFTIMLCT